MKVKSLLFSNFISRIPFFLFKYTGMFYFVLLLNNEAKGNHLYGWIMGAAYIMPLLWSRRINTVDKQIRAVWFGCGFLISAYVLFYFKSLLLSGLLFAMGFGLVNPNFKSYFGYNLSKENKQNEKGFIFLMLSVNGAAVVAAFLAKMFIDEGLDGFQEMFLFNAFLMAFFGVLWWFNTRKNKNYVESTSNTIGSTSGAEYSLYKTIVVFAVIILATFFWIGYELKSVSLHSFAKQYLCPETFGFPIAFTYLQSINPIFYVILAPVFALILKVINKKYGLIHSFYLMSTGVIVLGASLLIFNYQIGKMTNCVDGHFFILMYVLFTVGELLIEPIGLDFINRNIAVNFLPIFIVLWECNSGIAYIISSYRTIDEIGLLGIIILSGGVIFFVLTPLFSKYAK